MQFGELADMRLIGGTSAVNLRFGFLAMGPIIKNHRKYIDIL